MIASALIFAVLVAFGGLVAMLMRAVKTNGVTEATLTETEADLKGVTEAMKAQKAINEKVRATHPARINSVIDEL